MDASMIAGLAGAVGVLVGAVLGVWLSRRRSGRASGRVSAAPPVQPETPLPPDMVEVLSTLRSAAVVLDASDAVLRATPAAHAMGLVRGKALLSPALLGIAREVRRSGELREAELRLPKGRMGGETVAAAARVAPLGTELTLLLVEDRTESRRVDAVRRDFVANVSHELKTPVGALSLLAEAVLGASDDPEAVRRFAGRMQHESRRLSHLVQELIDLSRLQSSDPLERPCTVDVDAVVVDAIDRCRMSAQTKAITLVTGGDSGVSVLGDEEQLVTALRNLIDNAISYSTERTRVAVGVRRTDEVVELSVTDQGIGIPEADRERIFERFYRVDPARSRATGGTGLGLSIVKHITANHGGEVSVWSREGSGSTFTMRLPVEADGAADPPPVAQPPVRPAAEPAPPAAEPAAAPAPRSSPAPARKAAP